MGMFGRSKKAVSYDPARGVQVEQPSVGDRILNQAAMNLLGVDVLGMKRRKALAGAQNAFLGDLDQRLAGSPEADYQVGVGNDAGEDITAAFAPQFEHRPAVAPLDANSPELAVLAARAQRLGVPISQVLDVLKTQQPDVRFDRGYGYNGKTGASAGGFHPDLGQGVMPGPNGAQAVPGFAGAQAEVEGAKTGAQEQQKAAYDLVDVPLPNGSTVKMPRLMATQILSQHVAANGLPEGLGRSQTPTEASAAKIVGDATASAQVTLPSDLNTIDTAIQSATALRNHPTLAMRTGGWSILPAIPGTSGAAFEAYKKQVLGQGFIDARQALKGGGQITDYEGKKAEQAKIRMDAAQTPDDFRKALDDYIGALNRGRTILQRKAGQAPASGPRTTGFRSRILSVE